MYSSMHVIVELGYSRDLLINLQVPCSRHQVQSCRRVMHSWSGSSWVTLLARYISCYVKCACLLFVVSCLTTSEPGYLSTFHVMVYIHNIPFSTQLLKCKFPNCSTTDSHYVVLMQSQYHQEYIICTLGTTYRILAPGLIISGI